MSSQNNINNNENSNITFQNIGFQAPAKGIILN